MNLRTNDDEPKEEGEVTPPQPPHLHLLQQHLLLHLKIQHRLNIEHRSHRSTQQRKSPRHFLLHLHSLYRPLIVVFEDSSFESCISNPSSISSFQSKRDFIRPVPGYIDTLPVHFMFQECSMSAVDQSHGLVLRSSLTRHMESKANAANRIKSEAWSWGIASGRKNGSDPV